MVVFIWDRLPVSIVAVGTALSLWATGVLEYEQALAGFGDPTVVFIAALFVVSEGLDASGVTAWAGQELSARVGESRVRLVVFLMLLVAFLTALISVNGAVAALLPVAVVLAVRLRRPPSQLLMPLAFGAHAGSLLALTGTPVNVIVSDAADEAGVGRFGFFEFALVGLPLVVGTIAIIVLFGERLLPHRSPRAIPRDFSEHARTLVAHYGLEESPDTLLTRRSGVAEVVVPPRSEAVGDTVFPGMVTESGDWSSSRCSGKARTSGTRRRCRSETLCSSRAHGGRWTRPWPSRSSSSSTRRSSFGGRSSGSGRAGSARSPWSPAWSPCSRRAPSRRPSPACSPPAG